MDCNFCDPVSANIVSLGGGGCGNLLADDVEWEFTWLNNRPGDARITRPDCRDCDPEDWCDVAQFRFGNCLMWSGNVLDADMGPGDIDALTHSAILQKRIWPEETVLSGPPELIWNQIWADAGITEVLNGSQPPVTFTAKCGDKLWDTAEKLLGVYLGYTEAFGRICSYVDNPTGPALSAGWFKDIPVPKRVGASRADQVLVEYNDGNSKVWCPPLGADLGTCAGLQEFVELHEITDEPTAQAKACEIVDVFSRPSVELVGARGTQLDWESGLFTPNDLKPGTNHVSNLPGSVGQVYTVDETRFAGRGDCLEEVEVTWRSEREELARRFRADN